MRNRLGILLLLTIVSATLLGGLFGNKVSAGAPTDSQVTDNLLKTFTEALALVESNYAREVSSEDLVESAIRGMLRTLDPHSSFFATSDYSRLQEEQQGKYYGLGISIRAETPGSGRVLVVEPPAPGTPAYKAGLQAGDVISKVNGEPIDDWDMNEQVIPNLKGPKGTTVDVTVERPGEPMPLDFTVERDEIPLYTIKFVFHIRPSLGYLRIDKFAETTGRELDNALKELDEASLRGLILDLRDNPGGSLSAAIAVSDRFLERGQTIVSTKNRGGEGDRPYKAPSGSKYKYPMVVLINENSASASEIVSGALQDHDRALIVGETSFGKALVQTIYPLDGRRGLALTTGKYYTPSNRLIQRDYSEGLYDYFYNRSIPRDNLTSKHETDSGRPVYEGGGITPDEKVQQNTYSKLARELARPSKQLFYRFAGKLSSGELMTDTRFKYSRQELNNLTPAQRSELMERIEIADPVLVLFEKFARDEGFSFTDEEFQTVAPLVRNRLKQELFLSMFGEKEGYRVALELDAQLLKAIELLPEAKTLVQNSVASR